MPQNILDIMPLMPKISRIRGIKGEYFFYCLQKLVSDETIIKLAMIGCLITINSTHVC